MTLEDLVAFVNDNEKEDVKAYQNQLIDNIKEITKLHTRYFLLFIMLVFIHFMAKNSALDELQLGMVKISNLAFVNLLLPPFYAVLYLFVSVCASKKEALMFQVKSIQNLTLKYNLKEEDVKRNTFSVFNLSFLPFSLFHEIVLMLDPKRKFDLISLILYIVFLLLFGLFIFGFNIPLLLGMNEYWENGILVKLLIVLTWAVFLFTFLLFAKVGLDNQRLEKEDEKYWDKVRAVQSQQTEMTK